MKLRKTAAVSMAAALSLSSVGIANAAEAPQDKVTKAVESVGLSAAPSPGEVITQINSLLTNEKVADKVSDFVKDYIENPSEGRAYKAIKSLLNGIPDEGQRELAQEAYSKALKGLSDPQKSLVKARNAIDLSSVGGDPTEALGDYSDLLVKLSGKAADGDKDAQAALTAEGQQEVDDVTFVNIVDESNAEAKEDATGDLKEAKSELSDAKSGIKDAKSDGDVSDDELDDLDSRVDKAEDRIDKIEDRLDKLEESGGSTTDSDSDDDDLDDSSSDSSDSSGSSSSSSSSSSGDSSSSGSSDSSSSSDDDSTSSDSSSSDSDASGSAEGSASDSGSSDEPVVSDDVVTVDSNDNVVVEDAPATDQEVTTLPAEAPSDTGSDLQTDDEELTDEQKEALEEYHETSAEFLEANKATSDIMDKWATDTANRDVHSNKNKDNSPDDGWRGLNRGSNGDYAELNEQLTESREKEIEKQEAVNNSVKGLEDAGFTDEEIHNIRQEVYQERDLTTNTGDISREGADLASTDTGREAKSRYDSEVERQYKEKQDHDNADERQKQENSDDAERANYRAALENNS